MNTQRRIKAQPDLNENLDGRPIYTCAVCKLPATYHVDLTFDRRDRRTGKVVRGSSIRKLCDFHGQQFAKSHGLQILGNGGRQRNM